MRADRTLIAIPAALLATSALAQTTPWPTEEAIRRSLESHPFPSADRLGREPVPLPPRVDPPRSGIDIEAIARSTLQLPNASRAATQLPMPLRIFITLQMPKASLERLAEQASRTNAVLVLRGLKSNSMRETIAAVGSLIGSSNATWIIDPESFARFGVQHAPSFVLTLDDVHGLNRSGCTGACISPSAFVAIAGDVSLDYALEAMIRQKPALRPSLSRFLERLR